MTRIKFYGELIDLNEETGDIKDAIDEKTGRTLGTTYKIKGQLKKFCAATWDAEKKCWTVGSTATYSQQELIESLINFHKA